VKPKRRRARGTTPWINEEASSFGNFLRSTLKNGRCLRSSARRAVAKVYVYHFLLLLSVSCSFRATPCGTFIVSGPRQAPSPLVESFYTRSCPTRTFSACALSTAGYRYAKKFSYPTQHFIHCALLNGFSSTWSAVSQREFSVRQCLHSCLAAAGCPDASRNLPFRLCSKSTVLLRQPLSPGTNK
ncbi:hypothetical protein MTO96_051627, partial [Rhipicephalus appendiculatus]